MASPNEIAIVLKNRVKNKKYRYLWNKIIDLLAPDPRPIVKVILKDRSKEAVSGEITGACFGYPGRGHCDKIYLKQQSEEIEVIRLKDMKDIVQA